VTSTLPFLPLQFHKEKKVGQKSTLYYQCAPFAILKPINRKTEKRPPAQTESQGTGKTRRLNLRCIAPYQGRVRRGAMNREFLGKN
jgi:hypothetical protein